MMEVPFANLKMAYIHKVQDGETYGLPPKGDKRLDKFYFFTNYVQAGTHAYEHQLISFEGIKRLVQQANDEFDAIEPSLAKEHRQALREDIDEATKECLRDIHEKDPLFRLERHHAEGGQKGENEDDKADGKTDTNKDGVESRENPDGQREDAVSPAPSEAPSALAGDKACGISRALRRGGTLALHETALSLPPLVLGHAALVKEISKAVETLSTLKTDWHLRQSCLEKLARVVLGWTEREPAAEDLARFDRDLAGPLVVQIRDDRSAIVRQASMLCIVLGASHYASYLSPHLLPGMIEPLLKQCTVTVAVVAESATQALYGLCGCGCRKVLEALMKQYKHVHPVARRRVMEVFYDEGMPPGRILSRCGQGLQHLSGEAIRAALHDNSPPVRQAARLALCRLCCLGCSPGLTQALWQTMDAAQRKTAENLLAAGPSVLFAEDPDEECQNFNRSITEVSRSPRPRRCGGSPQTNSPVFSASPRHGPHKATSGRAHSDTSSLKSATRRSPPQSSRRMLSTRTSGTPERIVPASPSRTASASRSPALRPSLPRSPVSTTVSPEDIIASHLTSLEADPGDSLVLASLADFLKGRKCSAEDVLPVFNRFLGVLEVAVARNPAGGQPVIKFLTEILSGHEDAQSALLGILSHRQTPPDAELLRSFPPTMVSEVIENARHSPGRTAVVRESPMDILLEPHTPDEDLEQMILEAAWLVRRRGTDPVIWHSRFARLLMFALDKMNPKVVASKGSPKDTGTAKTAFGLLCAMLEVSPHLFQTYLEVVIARLAHFTARLSAEGVLDTNTQDEVRAAMARLCEIPEDPKRSLEALIGWLGDPDQAPAGSREALPLIVAELLVGTAEKVDKSVLLTYADSISPALTTIVSSELGPEVGRGDRRVMCLLFYDPGMPSHSSDSSHHGESMEELMIPSWITAISDSLDRLVLVLLRDDRKLIGRLKTYDQFGNIVLQKTLERHIVDGLYADIDLGVMIIRGENILLFGEVESLDMEPALQRAPLGQVLAREEMNAELEAIKGRMDLAFLDDGL
ncbi:SM-like, degradation of cytoplasmic mRNAs and positively regulates transcription initiation [Perkinsus olseni]|uniref:SM-like, degradation of cytoplasmic mRNAs and positively regulates transcription initiation n=1 Tax=Perkinsus olseni TaxID=32597 RepID=A0A7J6S9C2_PEROL|nr:SM-like, degradation of cytoplasmic mRNAs and positively regulates transcription initiation [Perkinsus olseni]KAF4733122.1 SM-like, degradation of cytoplasmic mRNAs and positively regulates transcription initiation [Perkinsus olseni]